MVGLGGLLAVPEVPDMVATLRVLHDAGASDALARLLTGPRWRIGPRDLVALGRRARALVRGEGDGRAAPGAASRAAAGRTATPLAEAVTDLTAETGSLVEALDDLGDPGAYSPAGLRPPAAAGRRAAAAARRTSAARSPTWSPRSSGCSAWTSRSRPGPGGPGRGPGRPGRVHRRRRRVHRRGSESTLGAFLAYLAAAEQEEFGLETGRVGESDSVKLLTVHAAKGLQWPAVFVPGLSAGDRSQVFPARPRVSTRWTDNPRLIPFGLRGDAGDLPRAARARLRLLAAVHARPAPSGTWPRSAG